MSNKLQVTSYQGVRDETVTICHLFVNGLILEVIYS